MKMNHAHPGVTSMRLAKFLAEAGIASRRRAEQLITSGRVEVNGELVTDKAFKINPDTSRVAFDGKEIATTHKTYVLLNKPAGYISSVVDPHGRPTVLDLIYEKGVRLYPVGRLDLDTEGLLLLTNDGKLTNLLIHPRYHVQKRYEAWVKGEPVKEVLNVLRTGIELEDGKTAPAAVQIKDKHRGDTLLEISIFEGRKRQVKRMCAAIGHPVIKLKRTGFAMLDLTGVPVGKYRRLNSVEVEQLYASVGSNE